MTVRVREAGADDAAGLHGLAEATFALACPSGTTDEAISDFLATALSETSFVGYLADPKYVLLLAEVDGVAAGYSMLVAEKSTDPDVVAAITGDASVGLSKFYVTQTHHGAGVAAVLMAATLEAARKRGAASVWLGVNEHNARANRFYEKNGFAQVGTKHFRLGGRWEDDFVRELVFPKN